MTGVEILVTEVALNKEGRTEMMLPLPALALLTRQKSDSMDSTSKLVKKANIIKKMIINMGLHFLVLYW